MDLTFADARVRRTARLIHGLSADLRRIQLGLAPGGDELAEAPVIENWLIGYRLEPAIVGTVRNHPDLADGPVTTSSLFILDPGMGFARTMSRFYVLGQQRRPS